MCEIRAPQENAPGPIPRAAVLGKARGWRVSLYDSYESHKVFAATEEQRLLAAHILPMRIPGGITGEVQPVDVGYNQPFKQILADMQQDWEKTALAERGHVRPTRVEILERVLAAHKKLLADKFSSDATRNGALVFKWCGITNKLDGSEDDLLTNSNRVVWDKAEIPAWRANFLAAHPPGFKSAPEVLAELETRGAVFEQDAELPEADSNSEPASGEDADEDSGAEFLYMAN